MYTLFKFSYRKLHGLPLASMYIINKQFQCTLKDKNY